MINVQRSMFIGQFDLRTNGREEAQEAQKPDSDPRYFLRSLRLFAAKENWVFL